MVRDTDSEAARESELMPRASELMTDGVHYAAIPSDSDDEGNCSNESIESERGVAVMDSELCLSIEFFVEGNHGAVDPIDSEKDLGTASRGLNIGLDLDLNDRIAALQNKLKKGIRKSSESGLKSKKITGERKSKSQKKVRESTCNGPKLKS